MNWYAVFVETGKESIVQQCLRLQFGEDLTSLVPQRVVMEKRHGKFYKVTKKLFPGYIFLYMNLNSDIYHHVISLPSVYRILGAREGCIAIQSEEMIPLLRLLDGKEIIEVSKIAVNSDVRVISGPLLGLEGLIQKINMHTRRAKIAVSFNGNVKLIDLGIELLETIVAD